MAELIGAVAAASQLGSTCFSLVDLLKQIKGATATLQRYRQQLHDLRTLSLCISANPLLQTSEVESYTKSLLLLIDQSQLDSLLRKGRFLRTWHLLQREQDLHETFAALERQKTSLSLAIEDIQARAIHQIQADIGAMASKQKITTSDTDAAGMDVGALQVTDRDGSVTTLAEIDSRSVHHQVRPSAQLAAFGGNIFSEGIVPDAIYSGCTAAGNVTQHNGVTHVGPGDCLNGVKRSDFYCFYSDCKKTGPGSQVNGLDMVCTDGQYTAVFEGMRGQWHGCNFGDEDEAHSAGGGKAARGRRFDSGRVYNMTPGEAKDGRDQFNGGRVVHGKRGPGNDQKGNG